MSSTSNFQTELLLWDLTMTLLEITEYIGGDTHALAVFIYTFKELERKDPDY